MQEHLLRHRQSSCLQMIILWELPLNMELVVRGCWLSSESAGVASVSGEFLRTRHKAVLSVAKEAAMASRTYEKLMLL